MTTSPSLSVNRLVTTTVNLNPIGAQGQSLQSLLILGPTGVATHGGTGSAAVALIQTERYRTYKNLNEVLVDYVVANPEYLAAYLWFKQDPQPPSLMIGHWGFGTTAETALAAVQDCDDRFGQLWYSLVVLGMDEGTTAGNKALIKDIADYIESTSTNKHLFGLTTQDPNTLIVTPNTIAADTTCIAAQLSASTALNKRTFVQYSSVSPYAVVSALGRILPTDYNANNSVITLMYKNEPTVAGETLSGAQMDFLVAKYCNVFVKYNNNTAIIQPGVVSSGDFVDTIINVDWVTTQIQTQVFNLLYASKTKIPQTDGGNQLITSVIGSVCAQAVANGICAPGLWDGNSFGTLKYGDNLPLGFYVYAPPVSSQTSSDRAARKSVSIQVALKLAGAIQSVAIAINVSR